MLEETELVKKLREIVWEADLCTTTAGTIRKELEEHFGIDLSSKKQKRLINLQINCFLEEQLKKESLNEEEEEEVREEEGETKDQKEETSKEEEERGIGNNGVGSCFQNLKAPSKGKESEGQYDEGGGGDATSKSNKAVEQSDSAREDEAPTKLNEIEKQLNERGKEVTSQSKETVDQLVNAGEEEIPSKSKHSRGEKQDEDMRKSEKPRKKHKRRKIKEAPSKSVRPPNSKTSHTRSGSDCYNKSQKGSLYAMKTS